MMAGMSIEVNVCPDTADKNNSDALDRPLAAVSAYHKAELNPILPNAI